MSSSRRLTAIDGAGADQIFADVVLELGGTGQAVAYAQMCGRDVRVL